MAGSPFCSTNMAHIAKTGTKQMVLEAVVIRADGTREDLGAIAYWHHNPLRRWWWALTQTLRGRRAGRIA